MSPCFKTFPTVSLALISGVNTGLFKASVGVGTVIIYTLATDKAVYLN